MGTGHNSNNAVYSWKDDSLSNGFRSSSDKWLSGDAIQSEVYHRWYMKIPSDFNKAIESGFKFWRYILRENGYSGPPLVYLNAYGSTLASADLVVILRSSEILTVAQISDFNDGNWHSHELRIKLNTNGNSDGIVQYWLDGVLKATHSNLLFDNSVTDLKIYSFEVGIGNVSDSAWYMSEWTAAAFDDVTLSTSYIGTLGEPSPTEPPPTEPPPTEPPPTEPPVTLFQEDFENGDLASLGWYDNTSLSFSTTETMNSTRSAEFHFAYGASTPESGGAIRRQFDDSESIYVSYWVKYSSNWQEQTGGYGHHEFYLMTNRDGPWDGLAFNHLTGYIENHDLYPVLTFQDGKNIDQGNIGVDLTARTESRGMAGCNGDSDGHGDGACYDSGGGTYWNGKFFKASTRSIIVGQWHKVETFFKLNSIVDSKGIPDGQLRYWVDGVLVIDKQNVMMRSGQYPDMKFNQIIIAPYMGNGAPTAQTFWVDNLVVSTTSPENAAATLSAPIGFSTLPPQ